MNDHLPMTNTHSNPNYPMTNSWLLCLGALNGHCDLVIGH